MPTEMPPNENASAAREPKSFMRFIPHSARILLGLMFCVFGLNGVLMFVFGRQGFIPQPKEAMPADVMTVFGGLMKGGYMTVAAVAQLLAGALLLANRFVPLALAMLAPIVVGILTFHIAVQPATIGPGIVVALLELYLAWAYRNAFRSMLAARARPEAK